MNKDKAPTGPLSGARIVEFAGIGPGPYASMMLSDMGADVVTITRPGQWSKDSRHFLNRGRRAVELDLKKPEHVAQALDLIDRADALIEGFRPLVMERLGLGPEETLKRNPRLVYGRMTGWGQDGPLSQAAGHDINYIAITGALDSSRSRAGDPVASLNLVGDYGGGALFLVVGLLAGIIEARASGKGQVVDVAMCDGVTSMLTMFHAMHAQGTWSDKAGTNLIDGGAHFYGTYKCGCGNYLALGAIEPQFYAELRERAGLSDSIFEVQRDPARWPEQQEALEALFLTKKRDEWMKLLEGTDACVSPVIGLFEAPSHPHLKARNVFLEHDGHLQPAPAPRFSRTPSAIQHSAAIDAVPASDILSVWSEPPLRRSRV